ncbi:MAG TPA: hypothetical protein VK841_10040 [Polyangiaceae bacterium]|nr:hypothetical protein [Polyangiaceae bacterium]
MSTLLPGVLASEEAQGLAGDIDYAIGRIALRYKSGNSEAKAEIERSIIMILASVAELESLACDIQDLEEAPAPRPRPPAPSDGNTIAFAEAAAKIKARRAAERRESP